MAITRAQQVRQMLNGGGAPSNRGDIGGNQPSRGESLHGGESVKDAVRRGELFVIKFNAWFVSNKLLF